ncbi:MAG TPA: HD domain-containing phosphohydrolase [Thermoleophilaceae bacterium]|nr:HD domain-containing phosphohydrolase [Thermoleophilaceae bacterium]
MAAHATAPDAATSGLRELGARLRHALPQGNTLPEEVWRRRHHALLILLWAHVVGLTAFGAARGYGVVHSAADGVVVAIFAGLAMVMHRNQRVASALVSLGLITSSAVLVHVWGGVIEAHFHFFVVLTLLTLYEDWLPFLLAAAYVVVHHGIAGAVSPESVYNHPAAIAHPWHWAMIHGAFVAAAGVGAVTAWRLNEDVRAETREAYRKARESEERFKSAFEDAPIGMVLLGIEPDDFGRFIQVNRAMCEIVGRTEDDLRARSLQGIVTEDASDDMVALLEGVLAGERASHQAETGCLRVDGTEVSGLINVSLIRDGAGLPVHLIAQIQDISDRKRAQELLEYQAFHDPLTELPNRRRLMDDLTEVLGRATAEEPVLLVLFDLDGFKAYNDTFGHPAGDALLSRIGHTLRDVVGAHGTAYRMGGDEFCVLGNLLVGDRPLASFAADAISEYGDGFSVTASYGSVVLPLEAENPSDALRRADQRLYAGKGSGRASAGRQATDAVLSVLTAHSSHLATHLTDVTDLCEAVADALEIPDEEMTHLLQAAALHDVGKVGIPDAILGKEGPLDDEEWGFVRTHTVIGERILSSAPALTQASRLVRSTHERFDGNGYPDGLAGEDIPLGSRVIAVCDAYDAMISDRPYRSAMSPEGAQSELRRGAGTQFDPHVVKAFLAVLASPRLSSDRLGASPST